METLTNRWNLTESTSVIFDHLKIIGAGKGGGGRGGEVNDLKRAAPRII